MGGSASGWMQGITVVAIGAAIAGVFGGWIAAVVVGVISVVAAVPYGQAIAQGSPYEGSSRGVTRCLVDATWSSLNTFAGAWFYLYNRSKGNVHVVARSRSAGSIWLRDGVIGRYATTIGIVKAGSSDRMDRHEELHVLQARLFGPLYLPLVGLNYVLASILPYWLLFRDKERYPITGLSSYFENGVYPHVWNELWAYRATER